MKTPSSSGKDMHVYEFDENATDLTKVSPTQEPYEYERPTLIKDDSRDCRSAVKAIASGCIRMVQYCSALSNTVNLICK